MFTSVFRSSRQRSAQFITATAVTLLLVFGVSRQGNAAATDTTPIVRVRASWQIQLNKTDAKKNLPQLIAVMSADGSVTRHFGLLTINHVTLPKREQGGVQAALWCNDTVENYTAARGIGVKSDTVAELIAFDTELEVVQDSNSPTGRCLVFRILNFRSQTWGAKASEEIRVPTRLESLDWFDPQVSVDNSGPTIGGGYVDFMKIVKIQYGHQSGKTEIIDQSTSIYPK